MKRNYVKTANTAALGGLIAAIWSAHVMGVEYPKTQGNLETTFLAMGLLVVPALFVTLTEILGDAF